MESSSVSTSMRRPLVDQCHQYSSIEPWQAMSLSAMSRAPAALWSSFSGITQPSTDTPVRSTSIGWAEGGSCSSAVFTAAGRPRRRRSLVL
ncbi:hypothetical protein GALL_401620 [mine drainage metagenome]|uniref:Uncharacterized protein n=1 Tax=mine drainage metagenome TaxID=410659 RepID=A0A1J5QDR8_9ZZZZ